MAQVTVTTTAQAITSAARNADSEDTLFIQNPYSSSVSVFAGRLNTVTISGATKGVEILPGGHFAIKIGANGATVYMIAASSTPVSVETL